jgi:[CysO sulfur-carrier protein]-S-L-cysteine hydrolase
MFRIRKEVLARMREEAGRTPSEECCGLLAGRDGVITVILPAVNALASATAFEIAPAELFRLIKKIRADGLDLLGIFHSHPTGENKPSARDIELAFYPDAAYFIVSPLRDAPQPVRAFSIREGRITELAIEPV